MRKLTSLVAAAGLMLMLGAHTARGEDQPAAATAAPAATDITNWWSTDTLFHTGVKPGATFSFNPATPQGWATFLSPQTHELWHMAFTNPAQYVQFMTPQFYMQFMNPNNWMAWFNPASYATFMDPATYMYWMTPQAYTHFFSPVSYMQMMNPAAYMGFFNPATYMAWMDPTQYALSAPGSANTGSTDFFSSLFESFAKGIPAPK